MNKLLDLYSDYLISAFGQTTATGLSALLNSEISHDQVTRFLAKDQRETSALLRLVKAHVRQIESPNGVLIVDDSISEKSSTDEHEIVCWHCDHAQDRTVKDINFMTVLYHQATSLKNGPSMRTIAKCSNRP